MGIEVFGVLGEVVIGMFEDYVGVWWSKMGWCWSLGFKGGCWGMVEVGEWGC